MSKKVRIVLLAILAVLVFAFVLPVADNFIMDNAYNDKSLQGETNYIENAENIQEKITEDEITAVYITTYGEKYHRKYCRYLKYTNNEITLNKAKRFGYTPCGVCKP